MPRYCFQEFLKLDTPLTNADGHSGVFSLNPWGPLSSLFPPSFLPFPPPSLFPSPLPFSLPFFPLSSPPFPLEVDPLKSS